MKYHWAANRKTPSLVSPWCTASEPTTAPIKKPCLARFFYAVRTGLLCFAGLLATGLLLFAALRSGPLILTLLPPLLPLRYLIGGQMRFQQGFILLSRRTVLGNIQWPLIVVLYVFHRLQQPVFLLRRQIQPMRQFAGVAQLHLLMLRTHQGTGSFPLLQRQHLVHFFTHALQSIAVTLATTHLLFAQRLITLLDGFQLLLLSGTQL